MNLYKSIKCKKSYVPLANFIVRTTAIKQNLLFQKCQSCRRYFYSSLANVQ